MYPAGVCRKAGERTTEKKFHFDRIRTVILAIMNVLVIAAFLAGSGIYEFLQSGQQEYNPDNTLMIRLFVYLLTYTLCALIESNQHSRHIMVQGSLVFRSLLYQAMTLCLFSMFTWLFDGRMYTGARFLVHLSNNVCLILAGTICVTVFIYCIFPDGMLKMTRRQHLVMIPAYIALALVVVHLFHPFLFNVDAENVYHRRGGWYLWAILPLSYIFAAIVITGRRWRRTEDAQEKRLNFYRFKAMLLAVAGGALQVAFYGIDTLWPFAVLAFAYLYINVQGVRYEESNRELTDMRISVMLSQIKPHFLFNTLTGIIELQDSDPKHAKDVTLAFADYLRSNMLSVTMTDPIPFTKELKHLKDFVVIEEMRYGERLKVVYDIQTESFLIPPMTLQPSVENAVRHGLMAREEGGTIWIRSYEDNNYYYVEVQDNGVGFDTSAPLSTDRVHVGVANIRERLMKQCNGSLTIESTPGEGTCVRVAIPKEDKNENLDN